jgi:hypothetical protein
LPPAKFPAGKRANFFRKGKKGSGEYMRERERERERESKNRAKRQVQRNYL